MANSTLVVLPQEYEHEYEEVLHAFRESRPAEHWQMYLRYDGAIARDSFKTLEALQKLQHTHESRKQTVGQAVSPAQSDLKVTQAARVD